jgi:head-tail adaptor
VAKKYTFREQIEVLRPQETRDEFGGVTMQFAAMYSVWATVDMKQTKPMDFATYQAAQHLAIVCKNFPDRAIFEADKIKWRSKTYRILSMSADYNYYYLTCYEAKD